MQEKKEKIGRFMEQKQKSFNELLAFGEEGEHEVANYLISQGVTVMPLYQFEPNEAPYFVNKIDKIVAPDLICFKNDAFLVEVKTKNRWIVYNGVIETGLDKRLYNEYNKIQEITKKPVYIFFNHKQNEPIGIYYTELNNFTRIWDGKANGEKKYNEMVFYNIEVLKKFNL